MKGPGRMFVDNKYETTLFMGSPRFWLGRFLELPFGCVFR